MLGSPTGLDARARRVRAQAQPGHSGRASLKSPLPPVAAMPRKLFVTTALPYANAPFHIGHMMEYIQADIWVRFQRMRGHEVHFVCADDAHGAPIMIAADKAGKTPQAVRRRDRRRPQALPRRLPHLVRQLALDRRRPRTTPSPRTSTCTCRKEGLIAVKSVEQFFDPVKSMFLPDRYIKGECPVCGAQGPATATAARSAARSTRRPR